MGYRYIVRQQSIDYPNRFERDILLSDYLFESDAKKQVENLIGSLVKEGYEKYPAMGPYSLRKIDQDGKHESYIVLKIEPIRDNARLG